MIKFVLLLVYLLGGELRVEQKSFATEQACEVAGMARVVELNANPRFDRGFLATCVETRVTEAKAETK